MAATVLRRSARALQYKNIGDVTNERYHTSMRIELIFVLLRKRGTNNKADLKVWQCILLVPIQESKRTAYIPKENIATESERDKANNHVHHN